VSTASFPAGARNRAILRLPVVAEIYHAENHPFLKRQMIGDLQSIKGDVLVSRRKGA
jgi:hypothetical protein